MHVDAWCMVHVVFTSYPLFDFIVDNGKMSIQQRHVILLNQRIVIQRQPMVMKNLRWREAYITNQDHRLGKDS